MDLLILDKRADLPVYHPVELGHKDNIITEFPVLGEEGKPFFPAFCVPLPSVKKKLTLVYYQQNTPLMERMVPEVVLRETHQKPRREGIIGTIEELPRMPSLDPVICKIKVADTGPALGNLVIKDLGCVQRLPGTGRTGIQVNHEEPLPI